MKVWYHGFFRYDHDAHKQGQGLNRVIRANTHTNISLAFVVVVVVKKKSRHFVGVLKLHSFDCFNKKITLGCL